jgi:hypothetical protein
MGPEISGDFSVEHQVCSMKFWGLSYFRLRVFTVITRIDA